MKKRLFSIFLALVLLTTRLHDSVFTPGSKGSGSFSISAPMRRSTTSFSR